LGIAVFYVAAKGKAPEQIFLVVESRASSLREQCLKRLQTAKLPAATELTVAFKTEVLADSSPETIHEACRKQVISAAGMRRELRPAMR